MTGDRERVKGSKEAGLVHQVAQMLRRRSDGGKQAAEVVETPPDVCERVVKAAQDRILQEMTPRG
jgi:hypothetical protein